MPKYYIRFKHECKCGKPFSYIGMDGAPSAAKSNYCFTTNILDAEMFDIHEANSLVAILSLMLNTLYVRRSLGLVGPPTIIPAENAAGVWPKSLARFMPDAT